MSTRALDVLNLGSINVDRVFRVRRIARPGETIASESMCTFAGGKGANQSVALARAGLGVAHAGKIGADGRWLLDKLSAEKIDVRSISIGDGATGQAIIQVDQAGENAIVLSAGANAEITPDDVERALADCRSESWLLVQNETSAVAHAIARAKQLGMQVAFNPAPADKQVTTYPLELVDLLCVNETEAQALSGAGDGESSLERLAARWPSAEIVLTLGQQGAIVKGPGIEQRQAACRVRVADTTAAGDTFLGYYLAGRVRGASAQERLDLATRAAALCVTRAGAMESIPLASEVALQR